MLMKAIQKNLRVGCRGGAGQWAAPRLDHLHTNQREPLEVSLAYAEPRLRRMRQELRMFSAHPRQTSGKATRHVAAHLASMKPERNSEPWAPTSHGEALGPRARSRCPTRALLQKTGLVSCRLMLNDTTPSWESHYPLFPRGEQEEIISIDAHKSPLFYGFRRCGPPQSLRSTISICFGNSRFVI